MSDPYQILGVSRDTSEEDIKREYRSLSRKYHPDANINNPNKAAAEAKFKEIQQAYQQIIKERTQGYTGQESYGGSNQTESGSPYGDFGSFWGFGGYNNRQNSGYVNEEATHLKAAANYINSGYYQEALNVLNDIPERTARWYYYSAGANSGIGNNITALEHAKQAVQLEPGNREYQELVSRFETAGTWYQNRRSPYGGTVVDASSLCIKLCIGNMICNLYFGGSGICCG